MNLTLRTQVVLVVLVLALGVLASLYYVATATGSARESITRLNRDRLSTIGENLARRYGSVIGFVAEEQFADSSLAERTELTSVMRTIADEELKDDGDVATGFFHSIWKREIVVRQAASGRDLPPTILRVLRLQVESTLESRTEQWSNTETGERNILILTRPVVARQRTVGVVWLAADMNTDLALAWPGDVTPIVLVLVLLGIGLGVLFLVNLRKEINRIQRGLAAMSGDMSIRLDESPTELGRVSAAINWLASTIVREQSEREALQRSVQHKEKLASLGKLIAGVAHEIRSPLSIIRTRVQLWQRQLAEGQASGENTSVAVPGVTMQMVVDELDRIEQIVRKLLYFARRRESKGRTAVLPDVITSVADTLRDDLQGRGIMLRLDLWSARPVMIDETELREVLLNLLNNAAEALGRDGTITVTTFDEEDTGMTGCDVHDTGPGIDATLAGSVFDPFFTTKETGTGLGLSIAYEIIRSYGGTVELVQAGRGTTFRVMLPSQQTDATGRKG